MVAHHMGVVSVVCSRPSDKHGRASAVGFLPTLLRCLLYQLVSAKEFLILALKIKNRGVCCHMTHNEMSFSEVISSDGPPY